MPEVKNRLIGTVPKVGIRPTIDGRYGGPREALEDQCMQMARMVAEFIQAEVRTADGQPAECVIADSCIGGFAEAAACAEKFDRAGVGVSLTVTPCWCYGSETMDLDPIRPKAIWGFNGTERPGAVYLAAALAGHSQKGIPAFGIYGRDVQDAGNTEIPADVQAKIIRFIKAGLAVAEMRGKAYVSLGSVSMGIAGSVVDPDFFQEYLGIRCEYVDMIEILRRMERGVYDHAEYDKAIAWVKANCKQGENRNKPEKQRNAEQLEGDWQRSVLMAMIARDIMVGNPNLANDGFYEEARGRNAIAGGFQGQRQWTDHLTNGDFMEAMLCSSFDWNGIRQPFVLATENDSLNGVAMLLIHQLTGQAAMFSDVRTFWSPDAVKRVTGYTLDGHAANGIIHLINSGASALDWSGASVSNGQHCVKNWWEMNEADVKACLDATTWYPANTEYFRGGGYSSNFETVGGMPCTMVRVNMVKGLGPVLQIAEGYTVQLPGEVNMVLTERTDPTWPTTWFAPRVTGEGAFKDAYSVMSNWGANHGAISYGHIGADLLTMASMLRIPVDMHNVPEADMYRPSSWARFGTSELEGADYRACAAYGPLYK